MESVPDNLNQTRTTDPELIAEQLRHMAMSVQSDLNRDAQQRTKEGLEIGPDNSIIPGCWPTRRALQNWITTMNSARQVLTSMEEVK